MLSSDTPSLIDPAMFMARYKYIEMQGKSTQSCKWQKVQKKPLRRT